MNYPVHLFVQPGEYLVCLNKLCRCSDELPASFANDVKKVSLDTRSRSANYVVVSLHSICLVNIYLLFEKKIKFSYILLLGRTEPVYRSIVKEFQLLNESNNCQNSNLCFHYSALRLKFSFNILCCTLVVGVRLICFATKVALQQVYMVVFLKYNIYYIYRCSYSSKLYCQIATRYTRRAVY